MKTGDYYHDYNDDNDDDDDDSTFSVIIGGHHSKWWENKIRLLSADQTCLYDELTALSS